MLRLLDITLKDLTQLLRARKTFLFSLIMPIALTLLIGFALAVSGRAATHACQSAGWI